MGTSSVAPASLCRHRGPKECFVNGYLRQSQRLPAAVSVCGRTALPCTGLCLQQCLPAGTQDPPAAVSVCGGAHVQSAAPALASTRTSLCLFWPPFGHLQRLPQQRGHQFSQRQPLSQLRLHQPAAQSSQRRLCLPVPHRSASRQVRWQATVVRVFIPVPGHQGEGRGELHTEPKTLRHRSVS